MDVRSPLFQNIALILAGVLFLNPIVATAAQLTVDAQAGGNTSLGQAANGVPIVNIATPNGSGLSHNKFTDYNVGKQGLILNNATERLQSTQQGGIIIGNSNLNGRAAGVILNEVTGSNRSQLKGYTEVAGQAAHVIVANPHGITCEGCGFINTPRATLSTGAPVIENGRLDRFDVDGGDIRIEGEGLNASNVDQFDLITRSAKINAEIHAKRLNIVAGRNEVDAGTLQATAKADDGSDKPKLAIDSSALGGMYAGAIRLVGTEKGVGVKLAGDMAASAGDIQIDASGRLTMARTAARDDLQIVAGSAELTGPAYAGESVAIRTTGALTNNQSLAAANSIDVQAGRLDNTGIIEAGVKPDNSRNVTGNVRIDAAEIRNTGRVLASRDLHVDAKVLNNQGGVLSGQASASVQADSMNNQQGRLLSQGHVQVSTSTLNNGNTGLVSGGRGVSLQAAELANRGGEISSLASVDISSNQLDNHSGRVIGEQSVNIDVAGKMLNSQGVVSSNVRLAVHAGDLDNSDSGTLVSQGTLNARVDGVLDNSADGALIGQTHLDVAAGVINNSNAGLLSGGSTLSLKGDALDNRGGRILAEDQLNLGLSKADNSAGGIIDSRGNLNATIALLDNRDGGRVIADGELHLSAERVDNSSQGKIASQGDLTAQVAELNQQGGQLLSQGRLSLQGQRLDNSGGALLAAGQSIDLRVDAIDNRGGEISSSGRVAVTGQTLDNSAAGLVIGDQRLHLTVQRLLNHTKGVLSGRDGLLLDGESLDNSAGGMLNSLAAVQLNLSGKLDNREGLVTSEGQLSLTASELDNRNGALSSAGDLAIEAAHVDNRGGRLLTDSQIGIASVSLDNRQAGTISGKAGVDISTDGLTNDDAGRITSGAALSLIAETVSSNGGRIAATGPLSITAQVLDQRAGQLISESSLSVDLRQGALDNSQGGLIASKGILSLSNVGTLNNSQGSEISSDSSFVLATRELDNSGGRIISAQQLQVRIDELLKNSLKGLLSGITGVQVTANRLDNSAGGLVTSGTDLEVSSRELDNHEGGTLSAATTLQVRSEQVNNSADGLLTSGKALHLVSGGLNNQSGQIISQGELVMDVDQLGNRNGVLSAKQRLQLDAGTIANQNGLISSMGALGLSAASLDSSERGEVSAKGDLYLRVAELIQRQGSLIGEAGITLDLQGGSLDNRAGLISAAGPLSIDNLKALNNSQGGEVFSRQSYQLAAESVNNSNGGRLISSGALSLDAQIIRNDESGLISGWEGLDIKGAVLDNSAKGTLSSKNGELSVELSGQLDNRGEGALVSQGNQRVSSKELINSAGGIISTQGALELSVSGELDNSGKGLISAQKTMQVQARKTANQTGQIVAGEALSIHGDSLDNTAGVITSSADLELQLAGALVNGAKAQLASVGALRIEVESVDNRGGTLASQNVLQLLATSLNNADGGTLLARQELALRLTDVLDNSRDGLIYSQAGELSVEAQRIVNDKGNLQSAGDMRVTANDGISNRDGRLISSSGDLNVTAANLDSQRGVLDSAAGRLELAVAGKLDNRSGTAQGQTLSVTGVEIDNEAGHLSALNGDAQIDTGSFNNRDGGLYARGGLTLNAEHASNVDGQVAAREINFSLAGLLDNQSGLIESERSLLLQAGSVDNRYGSLRSLGSNGLTGITAASLDNRSGLIETANTNLSVQVGSLVNQAGQIKHLGSGSFGLATSQVMSAGGSFVTGSALTIDASSWVNDSLLQAASLILNIGNFTQTATGRLLAAESFTGSGGTWVNHGVLASDGTMSVALTGGYSGGGRLSSIGTLTLDAANLSVSKNASITSGAKAEIETAGQLSNQGVITSVGDLAIAASRVENLGTIGSSANLSVTTPTLRNENGLFFSGADMALRVGELVNYQADIYSLGNLDISGRANGSKANLIDNNSGTVESAGDMRLYANTLRNQRDRFATEQQRVSGSMNVYWDDFCDGKGCEWYFTSVERYEDVIVSGSASASGFIGAGGNFQFSGSLFDNLYSTVSAGGDITVGTDVFNNIGAGGGEERHLRSGVYTRDRGIYNTFINRKNLFNQYNNPASASYSPESMSRDQVIASAPGGAYYETSSYVVPVSGNVVASAIVQAGGAVNITASKELNNSVLRSQTAYVGDTSKGLDTTVGASTTPLVAITTQLPPDLAQKQVNPLTLPGFSLPTGQNGLFRLNQQGGQETQATSVNGSVGPTATAGQGIVVGSQEQHAAATIHSGQQITVPGGTAVGQAPVVTGATPLVTGGVAAVDQPTVPSSGHKYLIETNPAFANLGNFLNSDYMLGKIGYDPDQAQKRLGDGLYEQRLIRDAIIARTGQRFIAGLDSDEAMFRYLMDNAIASKESLQLTVGVSLSAAQVAALTHDIVWMEEVEVAGEKVLAPVLYLAQPANRLMANGALIQGRDVTLISGGELNNSGTLRASNTLSATAGTIENRGLIEASNRLELMATDSIRNAAGGIIAGRDVSLVARDGDIINERSVTTVTGSDRGYQYRADVVTAASRIEAANDLSIVAGRDVHSLGSAIQAGGDARIEAGRDVLIASQREEDSYSYQRRRETGSQYQVTQHASDLQVGGDLAISAGRDLGVIASRVEAAGNISLDATENLFVAAAANESHDESYRKHAGEKTQRIETSVSQQKAEIIAGGSLEAVAGSDMTLVASDLRSGDEAFFYAGGELSLLAEQNSDYSLYDMQKKGSWGSKKTQRDEVTTVRNVGTTITSGGDLTLISEGDQLYQRARLESGADLTLASGGAITFEAVKDLDQESHEKSKNSSMWTSAKGKGTTDETLLQSQMIAKGDIVISAVEGLNIDVKQVNQQTVSQTIDAMVKADPELAWIKEIEQRGDVDWRQVKEVHDSFKYSHSGLGGAAQLIIAIIVTYLTAGAGAALTGATSAAGMAASNVVVSAVASNAAVSTINNRGNLGAVLKDVTSEDALRGYVVSGVTAGLTTGVYDGWFNTETGAAGALPNSGKVLTNGGLSSLDGIGRFAGNQLLQNGTSTVLDRALGGDSTLSDALRSSLASTFAAAGFNLIGDKTSGENWDIKDGSPAKIGLHAVMGGLAAEAAGGDFRTGALAAGVNEALVDSLAGWYEGMEPDAKKSLLVMNSQVIGVLTAAAQGGDEKSLQIGAQVAGTATQYNHLTDHEMQSLTKELSQCAAVGTCDQIAQAYFDRHKLNEQALNAACSGSTPAACQAKAAEIHDAVLKWQEIGYYVDLDGQPAKILQAFHQFNLAATADVTAANALPAGKAFVEALGVNPDNEVGAALVGTFASFIAGKAATANKGPVFRTNKEARVAAEALGYKKVNETVHGGQAVYTKDGFYITRDLDGHNGGAWKMASSIKDLASKSTRLGTYDASMNRIGD